MRPGMRAVGRLAVIVPVLIAVLAVPARSQEPPDELSDDGYGYVVERFVSMTNRFGQRIALDIYSPAVDGAKVPGRWPAILESSAYRDWTTPQPTKADAAERTYFARRGYVYVFADVPGTGGSDGVWCLLCSREAESGADVVEWIAAQDWSDGNVGVIGNSYPGIMALLIAGQAPPHLRAALPGYAYSDLYTDFAHIGGMDRFEDTVSLAGAFTGLARWTGPYDPEHERFAELWTARQAQAPRPFLTDLLLPGPDGPYFRDRSPVRTIGDIRVPVLLYGGFNDMFARGVIENFHGITGAPRYLRMTPTTHLPVFVPPNTWQLPEAANGEGAQVNVLPGGLAWFDHWLKGKDTPEWRALDGAPVRYYEQVTGEWRSAVTWPPDGSTTRTLHLRSAGRLTGEAAGDEPSDTFAYAPTGATSGRWFWRLTTPGPERPNSYLYPDNPADQRYEETAGLTYTTEPLGEDLVVTGPVTLRLYASSTATDADLVARLSDVAPDGTSYPVTSGWLRASHRSSHSDPSAIVPGEVHAFEIEIWPTSYRFRAGHSLRLALYGADTPRFLPGPHPGLTTVHHAADAPSTLDLTAGG